MLFVSLMSHQCYVVGRHLVLGAALSQHSPSRCWTVGAFDYRSCSLPLYFVLTHFPARLLCRLNITPYVYPCLYRTLFLLDVFRYAPPGHPELAGRIIELLEADGFNARGDDSRGYDHGTFIPLKLMYPDADIPVVQVGRVIFCFIERAVVVPAWGAFRWSPGC